MVHDYVHRPFSVRVSEVGGILTYNLFRTIEHGKTVNEGSDDKGFTVQELILYLQSIGPCLYRVFLDKSVPCGLAVHFHPLRQAGSEVIAYGD